MSEPEHVALAREAQAVGLIVTHLMPSVYGYRVQMWQPDGTLWIEGRHESAAMIRAHIDHWPAHRQALTEPGMRLVIPGDGHQFICGCLKGATDTTEESK